MPRKTKESTEETNVKNTSKSKTLKTAIKEKITKTASKNKDKKASSKKASKTSVEDSLKKVAKADKKVATKTTKKSTVAKTKQTSAKSTSKSTKITKPKSSSAKVTASAKKVIAPTIVEYYDLPYKYNQTVVKVLYQNPTTLFVYWEISDGDIENYKKEYGDNFFETTRPVLIVYNDTMNYHFDVDINDFANCWYFNINDSKCNYRVELVRRPIAHNPKINTEYVYITSSNKIESPNDRILFSTNEPYTVYFKNTKNNVQRKVNLPKLLESLNITNADFGFPIIRNVYDLYKSVYHIDNIEESGFILNNPSSGNPSSHSLSSRFI